MNNFKFYPTPSQCAKIVKRAILVLEIKGVPYQDMNLIKIRQRSRDLCLFIDFSFYLGDGDVQEIANEALPELGGIEWDFSRMTLAYPTLPAIIEFFVAYDQLIVKQIEDEMEKLKQVSIGQFSNISTILAKVREANEQRTN